MARAGAAIARVAVLAALAATTMSGCRVIDEKPCMEGQYPVRSREGGGACVTNGEKPPSGYETYPPGFTPTVYPPDNPPPDDAEFRPNSGATTP